MMPDAGGAPGETAGAGAAAPARVLALETSTVLAGVAVVDLQGVVAERLVRSPRRHLELLTPTVEAVLRDARLTLQDITGLAVSTGPGSFTGLRIGVMTAMALARVREIPAVGVSSLEVVAAACPWQGMICAALDAKRGEMAAALFVRERADLRRISEDVVAPPSEVLDRLAGQMADEVAFTGDALSRDAPAIAARLGARVWLVPPIHWAPRAALVGALARPRLERGEGLAAHLLRPVYGRGGSFTPAAGMPEAPGRPDRGGQRATGEAGMPSNESPQGPPAR